MWLELAHDLNWHMISTGTWSQLANDLNWHMISTGTLSQLTHDVNWHTIWTGTWSELAHDLNHICPMKCVCHWQTICILKTSKSSIWFFIRSPTLGQVHSLFECCSSQVSPMLMSSDCVHSIYFSHFWTLCHVIKLCLHQTYHYSFPYVLQLYIITWRFC